ncbi:uncharacterized protein M6B38_409915 [Iris pallida]|uniref:Uncharacterized protein n=1 Tax=Iris pallida TaxID=29817 RepID=A0AAX6FNF2_IRIPA|nr:uncharacterized protein M6B38_409915 [Iris pallida]
MLSISFGKEMVGLRIAGSNCPRWQRQCSPAIRHSRSLPSFSPSGGGLINLSHNFLSTTRRPLRINKLRRDDEGTITRSFSTTLIGFTNDDDDESDDEFVKRVQHLVHNFTDNDASDIFHKDEAYVSAEPAWPAVRLEPPPRWLDRDRDEIIPASVERKANSVDLPLSLRIIKKKKMHNLFREASESAFCSVKKAFSSMVFILRELQSYTLQMREFLFVENLQGIMSRVHGEMNASFVWLFQQIFSCTPTLMVYVMLLLANFTVHSISNHYALAAVSPNPTHQSDVVEYQQKTNTRIYPSSSIKTFSIGSRTASVDGSGGGGGGTTKPVAGATDDGSYYGSASSGVVIPEEEAVAWNRMLEEATRMQASARDESLMDHDTLQSLVSPVRVEVEADHDYEEYARTEMMYHQALALDPENTLLLSNFAQFLYLVLHDHDRAEYYFKRAVAIKPADAESLSRYASFLWLVRKDMVSAEENYLEAIAAEPRNSYYAANYAHFLWNTGGEGTCYLLDGSDAF